MSLDDELRRVLKPVDPGPGFTTRVLAAVEAARDGRNPAGSDDTRDARARSPLARHRGILGRRPWLWPALAASLVSAVVGVRWVEERREAERGRQATEQVMQALRVTSSKLNLARDVIADRR
jgi:hypothetical protein